MYKNPLFIQQHYKEVEEQEEKKQPQQGEQTEVKEQTAGGAVKWITEHHRADSHDVETQTNVQLQSDGCMTGGKHKEKQLRIPWTFPNFLKLVLKMT